MFIDITDKEVLKKTLCHYWIIGLTSWSVMLHFLFYRWLQISVCNQYFPVKNHFELAIKNQQWEMMENKCLKEASSGETSGSTWWPDISQKIQKNLAKLKTVSFCKKYALFQFVVNNALWP